MRSGAGAVAPYPKPGIAATMDDADLRLFIDGAWHAGEGRDARARLQSRHRPDDCRGAFASPADLDLALAAAERGFTRWRATDVETRGGILRRAAVLMRERVETIATLLTREQGKIIAEARAEVAASAQMFDWYAEEAKRAYGRVLVRPAGQRSVVLRQPVGPVAALSPWNFPVYLLAKKLAPALAAGCSVIAKPPEETPGCTTAFFRCLLDAGLPVDVAQLRVRRARPGVAPPDRLAGHPQG